MENILLDPNVGYLLLVGGFVLAILALFAPGTGVLEIGAVFALLLAGYTLANLPVNGWAIVLMIVAVFPLVLAVRRWRGRTGLILLLVAIAALILGSVFVYRTASGGPAVNPILAVIVSGGSGWLLWFMARKSLDAFAMIPSHSLDRLVGMRGTVRSDIRPEGTVYVGGEEWSATSDVVIRAGEDVRVKARQGLVLIVEPLKEEDK